MSISNIPVHLGIIMDGNRRWARKKGLSTLHGHQRGYKRALEIAEYAFEQGLQYLTLFAFSSENWNRSVTEVNYLMTLFNNIITEQAERLKAKKIALRIIGSRTKLSSKTKKLIRHAETMTAKGKKGILIIAFNYGGHQEIVDAMNQISHIYPKKKNITASMIAQHLYTSTIPHPDMIIRTSGEHRLSGFMTWQSAYSELYFTHTLWPDFSKAALDKAITSFRKRKRRFGH